MKIRLHGTEERVKTLGPGIRYVVWVQGCLRRCPGCMSPFSQDLSGGYEEETDLLAENIVKSGCEGLTISGGEPFLQAEALVDLIEKIRMKKDMGVIIYTGNTWEELKASEDKYVQELLVRCDLLVDGAYVEELNDGKNLRGSSNQRAIPLTPRYEKDAAGYGTEEAKVEIVVHEDKIRLIGVPSRQMLKQLQSIIE